MRTTDLTRSDFVEWLGSQSRERNYSGPLRSSGGRRELTLVWTSESPEEAPIIAVDASEMRDFLAFATTYIGTFVPFTAFFRVIAREMLVALPRSRPRWPVEYSDALFGAIICDAAIQLRDRTAPKVSDISLQACLATPSASVARAALLGYESDFAQLILQRWFSVREELPNGNLRVRPEQLILFWTAVLAAFSQSKPSLPPEELPVVRFVSSVCAGGGVAEDYVLNEMGLSVPGINNLAPALRGNREDRVRVLERFAASLSPTRSQLANGMVLGYLASQVAEGSLNYIQLASRFADQFPLAVLWFGLFSGLNRNNDILAAGECLGRRLDRRLRPGLDLGSISADFSYEEFSLFLQEDRLGKIRTDNQSAFEVELVPGVSGRYRIQRNVRMAEGVSRAALALDEVRKVTSQLQNILRNAEVDHGTQVRELFDPRDQVAPLSKSRSPSKRKYK